MPDSCQNFRFLNVATESYEADGKVIDPCFIMTCIADKRIIYNSYENRGLPPLKQRADFCPLRDKLRVRSKLSRIVGGRFYEGEKDV